jgi:hypothetical protein
MRLLILFFQLNSLLLMGQVYETLPPEHIKTVIFKGSNQKVPGRPIIPLNGSLVLKFDDLRAKVADYYYEIEHYNFDWTKSVLAQNEFLEGFDNLRLRNFSNSITTLQSFTHYQLNIPNKDTRGLKKSGNYLLKIYNASKELIFSRKFMVYKDLVDVPMTIRRTRKIDNLDQQQVVNFRVGRKDFIFRQPQKTVKTIVVQNRDFFEAKYDLKPQFVNGNELVYRYDQKAAFMGSNEYLFFDNKSIRISNLQIREIRMGKHLYNTYLRTDFPRYNKSYTYNPDVNGSFRVNTQRGDKIDRMADYARVNFSFSPTRDIRKGEIHLYGRFNNYVIDDSTMLTYNESSGIYENSLILKQGFYNYKYVYLDKDGKMDGSYFSGSHDETENNYMVLVYYRDLGARFDRLIGIGKANSRNIVN